MLKSLNIDNYAIISGLNISWAEGLNTVTGQTGAGKSVILGALSLLSGQKADASLLLDKQRSLVIEGVFGIAGYGLEGFFEENGLDWAEEITARRQISPAGKSRCFIEDCPVSQTVMKELMDRLIDVHSQHQSLLLAREQFQMDILDSIAGCREQRRKVKSCCEQYESSRRKTEELRTLVESTERDRDYITFRLSELDELKITPGETSSLEERLSAIEHGEDIARALSSVYDSLDGSDGNICTSVQQLSRSCSSMAKYMESLSSISRRLQECSVELKDIASEAEEKLSSLSFDEEEKRRVEERLDRLNGAMSKYGVSDETRLLEKYEEMKLRLDSLDGMRSELSSLEKHTASFREELTAQCSLLTECRRKSIPSMESHVTASLSMLGIPKARFSVSLSPKEPSADGADDLEFLFSANELSPLQPIGRTASGGEISRLMLSLKSLAATRMKLPTIIFDEIDTGVSGAVADSMGDMIVGMSRSLQIINITHLPQIAAKGTNHYEVVKRNSLTSIEKLDTPRRIEKIAEMLSGADITDAARQQARQLLGII